MSIHKLILKEETSVKLLAVKTTDFPYKMAWRLNGRFGLHLMKREDYPLSLPESSPIGEGLLIVEDGALPCFEVFSTRKDGDEGIEEMVLVSNKDQGVTLFTEAKGFDMVIMNSYQSISAERLIDILEELEGVLAIKEIDCRSYSRFKNPFNYFDSW